MEEKEQILPEKCYERGMSHNYMVLSSYDFFGQEEGTEDYMTRMLLGNKIPGILPVICRRNAGVKQYCYEINSLQSLDRLYEKQEMGYEALHNLMEGIIRTLEHLEEYLLDGTQIILKPEYIYLHVESGEPFLVCYPQYRGDIRKSFMMLMDYLLTKIDHTQEHVVWLAYQIYRCTRNTNYVLGEVKELLFKADDMEMHSKQEIDDSKKNKVPLMRMDFDDNHELEERSNRISYLESETEHDFETDKEDKALVEDNRKRKNMWGGLLCILLALGAGGIILGSRLLKLTDLSQKQEISLYGAIGMSVVASLIFFTGLIKQWKQEEQVQSLSTEPEQDTDYWEQDMELPKEPGRRFVKEQRNVEITSNLVGETVLLTQEAEQERFLKGNINGEEIRVPLKHFPLTIGKLSEVADIIIPDNTVSRMHARLEQKNGQVYISDLNSTNGTIRNGIMINMNEEVALEPGDKIMFGRVCFTYC